MVDSDTATARRFAPAVSATAPAPAKATPRSRAKRPVWQEAPSAAMQTLKIVAICVICLVMLYPFVYVVAMSFASAESVTTGQLMPTAFSIDAYRAILGGGIISRALLNSLFITVVGTLLSTLITAMLAYGLMRTKQAPGARGVLILVLLTMFFGAGLIPNYLLVKQLGLLDTYWALILPVLVSPFNMVVMRAFFMGLPGELLEAARIDGASEVRIFFRIVLPLSKAVIAVIALFYAVGYWNMFFNAMLYIQDTDKWPIQLVLNQYVVQNSSISAEQLNPNVPAPPSVTIQSAVIVLATIPILCIYPFLQKYFTKGVLTGSIKG